MKRNAAHFFSFKKFSETIQFRLNGQRKTSISGQLRHVETLSTNCDNAETQNAANIHIYILICLIVSSAAKASNKKS